MVTHYRIKTAEFDTTFEMGKSFAFSIIFHTIIIAALLFSPGLLSEKKRIYFESYNVRLVELPKKEKVIQDSIQNISVMPAEPAPPPPLPAIEEPVKPPEPVIAKPEEIKTAPAKKKQKSKKKESVSAKKKKEAEPITASGKTEKTVEKHEEAYIPPSVQSSLSIKKTDETVASISPPVGDISLDTKEFPYEWYLTGIKNKIENRWSELEIKLLSGEIKKVIIKFKILRNGRIERPEIEKSSGILLVDNSALRAVLSSDPLPPLPKDFGEDYLVIHFGFEYKKNG